MRFVEDHMLSQSTSLTSVEVAYDRSHCIIFSLVCLTFYRMQLHSVCHQLLPAVYRNVEIRYRTPTRY